MKIKIFFLAKYSWCRESHDHSSGDEWTPDSSPVTLCFQLLLIWKTSDQMTSCPLPWLSSWCSDVIHDQESAPGYFNLKINRISFPSYVWLPGSTQSVAVWCDYCGKIDTWAHVLAERRNTSEKLLKLYRWNHKNFLEWLESAPAAALHPERSAASSGSNKPMYCFRFTDTYYVLDLLWKVILTFLCLFLLFIDPSSPLSLFVWLHFVRRWSCQTLASVLRCLRKCREGSLWLEHHTGWHQSSYQDFLMDQR